MNDRDLQASVTARLEAHSQILAFTLPFVCREKVDEPVQAIQDLHDELVQLFHQAGENTKSTDGAMRNLLFNEFVAELDSITSSAKSYAERMP